MYFTFHNHYFHNPHIPRIRGATKRSNYDFTLSAKISLKLVVPKTSALWTLLFFRVWISRSRILKIKWMLKSKKSVTLIVYDLLRQDAGIQELYFNISEMKQSISDILYLMPLSMTLFGLKTAMWLIASLQRNWRTNPGS